MSQSGFDMNTLIYVPTDVYYLSSIIHEPDRRSFQRISYL